MKESSTASAFYGDLTVKVYDSDGNEQLSMATRKVIVTHVFEELGMGTDDDTKARRTKNVVLSASMTGE
jgi:hypothetical protein